MKNFSVGTERCLSDLRRTQSTCVEQDPSQSRFCTSNVARSHSGKMVRQLPTRGIYIYIYKWRASLPTCGCKTG